MKTQYILSCNINSLTLTQAFDYFSLILIQSLCVCVVIKSNIIKTEGIFFSCFRFFVSLIRAHYKSFHVLPC